MKKNRYINRNYSEHMGTLKRFFGRSKLSLEFWSYCNQELRTSTVNFFSFRRTNFLQQADTFSSSHWLFFRLFVALTIAAGVKSSVAAMSTHCFCLKTLVSSHCFNVCSTGVKTEIYKRKCVVDKSIAVDIGVNHT